MGDLIHPGIAARALGLHPDTLYAMIESGDAPYLLDGGLPYLQESDLAEMVRRRERRATGFVYFIGTKRRVKVGYTSNLAGRLAALQTGSPEILTVYAVIRGSMEDEREIHGLLDRHRLHGEWFQRRLSVQMIINDLRGTLSAKEVAALLAPVEVGA